MSQSPPSTPAPFSSIHFASGGSSALTTGGWEERTERRPSSGETLPPSEQPPSLARLSLAGLSWGGGLVPLHPLEASRPAGRAALQEAPLLQVAGSPWDRQPEVEGDLRARSALWVTPRPQGQSGDQALLCGLQGIRGHHPLSSWLTCPQLFVGQTPSKTQQGQSPARLRGREGRAARRPSPSGSGLTPARTPGRFSRFLAHSTPISIPPGKGQSAFRKG